MSDENTPASGNQNLADDPIIKQLINTTSALANGIKSLQTSQSEMNSNFTKLQTDGIRTIAPEPENRVSGDDINDMSQSELATFLIGEISKMNKTERDRIEARISDVSSQVTTDIGKQRLEKFVEENPQVIDLKEPIREKLQANPGMSIDDAYSLVRGSTPQDELATIDAKYSDKSDKQEKPVFGGMTPTSTTSTDEGDKAESGRMNKEEAANAAWEELVEVAPQMANSES